MGPFKVVKYGAKVTNSDKKTAVKKIKFNSNKRI